MPFEFAFFTALPKAFEKLFEDYQRSVSASKAAPRISIIIPACNEEQYMPATLEALARQTYKNFEVIVVTNGCTDKTAEVASGHCDQLIVLKEKGLGPARNLGAQKAMGEILLFLDADTLLEPDALKIVAQNFRPKHAMGTLKGQPDTQRLTYKIIYLLKNAIHFSHIHFGSSGVILCWKEHFQKVGGFDDALYLRENSHLMKRLRQFGRYKYIHRTKAVTSMRRYESKGPWDMIQFWFKIWILSFFSDLRNKTYG